MPIAITVGGPDTFGRSPTLRGSFARVGDLSAMNDEDWLMLGDAEEGQPDVPITNDLDPPPEPPETVRLLERPREFIVDDKLCLLVTALTSGGDSPEKLEAAVTARCFDQRRIRADHRGAPSASSQSNTRLSRNV